MAHFTEKSRHRVSHNTNNVLLERMTRDNYWLLLFQKLGTGASKAYEGERVSQTARHRKNGKLQKIVLLDFQLQENYCIYYTGNQAKGCPEINKCPPQRAMSKIIMGREPGKVTVFCVPKIRSWCCQEISGKGAFLPKAVRTK
jgi:hypothetical protein